MAVESTGNATQDEPVFEIGLVLAGGVSAGAYTAGVLDFLFEALDQWYKCRKDNSSLPQHNVRIRVITGASAGGTNAAIAAAACRYDFPPITSSNVKNGSANPFYKTWVKCANIQSLLDPSDLRENNPVRSLLNTEKIEQIALDVVKNEGTQAHPSNRAWLADPITLLLTVTNLQGIPYQVRFSGNTRFGHEMIMHRDHMGFSVPVFKEVDEASPGLLKLPCPNDSSNKEWKTLATTAVATGAFPLVLEAQRLCRPQSDYKHRFVIPEASDDCPYPLNFHTKDPHCFIAVDGGVMNNEPFNLARIELARSNEVNPHRNPRDGNVARSAIIMVDPFTDDRRSEPALDTSLVGVGKALIDALLSQVRFKPIDLALVEDEKGYSRYMIAPKRGCVQGTRALASGGMKGYLGFFCEAYRRHDYMLGRRNCQAFLRNWFVLPRGNTLFENWSDEAFGSTAFKSLAERRENHRQIIPLVGTADTEQVCEDWPRNEFCGYNEVKKQIKKRLDKMYAIFRKTACDSISSKICWPVIGWFIERGVKGKILEYLEREINAARDDVNGRQ